MNIRERLRARWRRMFNGSKASPWESEASAKLLHKVSQDAWACQMLAEKLEIQIDGGDSAADYVSQMLREHYRDWVEERAKRSIARIDAGAIELQWWEK